MPGTRKPQFTDAVRRGVHLAVGQSAIVDLELKVGASSEQVTVSADAPLVNVATANASGLVSERQVKDLPLNGRSFDQLMTLNPGVVNFTWERTGGVGVAVTPGDVTTYLLGIDAVREFNVLTDTYGAEYGKRSGAQVSVVTQSMSRTSPRSTA
jgi:hypothetical protein